LTREIGHAELVITHDTGAFHIAVALGKQVICISNGNSYGRFHPYPESFGAKVTMLYPDVDPGDEYASENFRSLARANSVLIDSISARRVMQVIEKQMV
jgi:ADP-heptose:LPS heptosyltransferase